MASSTRFQRVSMLASISLAPACTWCTWRGGTVAWPTVDQLLARSSALVEQLQRDPVVRLPPEFVMIGRLFATLGGLLQHHRPRLEWSRLARHLV